MEEKPQPGKPSVEAKLAEYQQNPEYLEDISRDKKQRTRENSIVRKFRMGARRPCAAIAWESIERVYSTRSKTRLSRLLKIRREEVYKARSGHCTLDMLVAGMTETELDWKNLDPLPPERKRGIAGFQLAIFWLQTGRIHPKEDELISEQHLLAVFFLLPDDLYRQICCDPLAWNQEDPRWSALADRLRPRLAEALALPENQLAVQQGQDVRNIARRWAAEVAECCMSIPHRWVGKEPDL